MSLLPRKQLAAVSSPGEEQSPDGRERCLLSIGLLGTFFFFNISISSSESFRDKSFEINFDCGLMGTLLKSGFINLKTSQLLTCRKKAGKTKYFSRNCSLVCVCCNGR